MKDNEQIKRLISCLRRGDAGRRDWNLNRDHRKPRRKLGRVRAPRVQIDYVTEQIYQPLSKNLSNSVRVPLKSPNLWLADLQGEDLSGYDLSGAFLGGVNLKGANLRGCNLSCAHMIVANLRNADLREADLSLANLLDANLTGANLEGAMLVGSQLLRTQIGDAIFDRCNIHGISIWGAVGDPARQSDLTITTSTEPNITVDDIEVGQFVYVLLNNKKVRNVLDTITSKVVLLLGRFSKDRKAVLDRLRAELRARNFSPILFDFDPSSNLDISDTVTLLARMARFVIADLTDPRSVQQELSLIAPQVMVAIRPIILAGHEPWNMFPDLLRRSKGLLPIHEYRDLEHLVQGLENDIIAPVEVKRAELLPRHKVA